MRRIGGPEVRRNVLVDVNNLLYRAHFAFAKDRESQALPPLTVSLPSAEGTLEVDAGLVHASLRILASWIYDIQSPTRIVAFFDGLPTRRLSMYPGYKKTAKDEGRRSFFLESSGSEGILQDGTKVHGSVSILSHVLRLLGCDVYHHPDEEADDMIATFVRSDAESGSVNIIMSSDKDFFQLVSGRTVVYRPGPKTPRIHDAERVKDCMESLYKVRVGPSGIRMFKALTGDSSDGIVGIRGLRKKVAAPMCHFGSVEEVYGSGLPGFSDGERRKTIESREAVELNWRLVGFFDKLDLHACLRPGIADFKLAARVLREDLQMPDADLLPFRVGPHSIRQVSTLPDWLSDV